MKKILAALFVSIPFLSSASDCSGMVLAGKFPQTQEPVTILCKSRYVIGYSPRLKAPLWVAEVLTKDYVTIPTVKRKDNFRPDPSIPVAQQAAVGEFANTGFDKGHMIPFDDMAASASSADESFFMTNMVPQVSSQNRGIWKSLEQKTRKLALDKGTVYVITGPIFTADPKRLSLGTPVPAQLWKVVISPATHESFTVIIPNTDGLSAKQLRSFTSDISKLNMQNPTVTISGIQFNPKPFN